MGKPEGMGWEDVNSGDLLRIAPRLYSRYLTQSTIGRIPSMRCNEAGLWRLRCRQMQKAPSAATKAQHACGVGLRTNTSSPAPSLSAQTCGPNRTQTLHAEVRGHAGVTDSPRWRPPAQHAMDTSPPDPSSAPHAPEPNGRSRTPPTRLRTARPHAGQEQAGLTTVSTTVRASLPGLRRTAQHQLDRTWQLDHPVSPDS
jgi:hypothetical protein